MAIKIPSKDIYEINNQKVVDNEIDNIEIQQKNFNTKKEYSVLVYKESFSNEIVAGDEQESSGYRFLEDGATNTEITTNVAYSIVFIDPKYMNVEITIYKRDGDKRIQH